MSLPSHTAANSGPSPSAGGALGLDPAHRQIADLIRETEILACRRGADEARPTADRLVGSIVDHLEAEQAALTRVSPEGRRSLIDGQRQLLERAVEYARQPAPDAGADLMALLVRQADAERDSLLAVPAAAEEHATSGPESEFITDWAIAESPGIGAG